MLGESIRWLAVISAVLVHNFNVGLGLDASTTESSPFLSFLGKHSVSLEPYKRYSVRCDDYTFIHIDDERTHMVLGDWVLEQDKTYSFMVDIESFANVVTDGRCEFYAENN